MLVLDGSDCVGKTTLQKLCLKRLHQLDMPHMGFHLTRPPERFKPLVQYPMYASIYSVWDRFHLSQLGYRKFDDHPFDCEPTAYHMVDAELHNKHGAFNVLVTVSNRDDLRARYNAERELYDIERVLAVNDAFISLGTLGVMDVRGREYSPRVELMVDTSGHDPDTIADKIVGEYLVYFQNYVEARSWMAD